jgi:hypothetical protein
MTDLAQTHSQNSTPFFALEFWFDVVSFKSTRFYDQQKLLLTAQYIYRTYLRPHAEKRLFFPPEATTVTHEVDKVRIDGKRRESVLGVCWFLSLYLGSYFWRLGFTNSESRTFLLLLTYVLFTFLLLPFIHSPSFLTIRFSKTLSLYWRRARPARLSSMR